MPSKSESLTNWLELPLDIMINILHRVCVIEIFENVEKVCTAWHKICNDPSMWRVIYMGSFWYVNKMILSKKICKLAVDRSKGQLVDLTIHHFADDDLLHYVADRSSQLKRLQVAYGSDKMLRSWNEALKKFPLLEELNLYSTKISKEAIETAGRYCPMLKTLKVNRRWVWRDGEPVEESLKTGYEFAKAIGENLFNLRHLELVGCSMSSMGLQVILDGCCHLESLDLRNCSHNDLNKDLQKRCLEQIKHLKLPEDCPYIYYPDDSDDFEEDEASEDYDDYEFYTIN